jgi:hypothetical protein
MLATDVLGIVLGVRGIDVPAPQVDGAAFALPAVPDGAVSDEVRDVLHERDARNLPEGIEFGFDGLELR